MRNTKRIIYSIGFIGALLLASYGFHNKAAEQNKKSVSATSLTTRDNQMNFGNDDDLVQLSNLTVKLLSGNSGNHEQQTSSKQDSTLLTSLSVEETANLLSALPKQIEQAAQPEFAWREGPRPPSDTELRKIEDWRPGELPTAPKDLSPLTILSATPNGKVSDVNTFQIRFSQDMYALGQQVGESGEKNVSIHPPVDGNFTWLDTRLLRFEAQPGFAQATSYTVEISDSLKAHSGNQLEKKYQFKFKTPAPKLDYYFPDNHPSVSQTPVVLLTFSTPVDPNSLLDKVYLEEKSTSKSKTQNKIYFRLATETDFSADPLFRKQRVDASNENSITIVPLEKLRKGEAYEVNLLSGVKPKVGDIVSEEGKRFSIKIEQGLKFVKLSCGYSDNGCRPRDAIVAEFSNVLLDDFESGSSGGPGLLEPFGSFGGSDQSTEEDVEQDKRIQVEPSIEGMRINVHDNKIYINGDKKPNTRYRVSVHGTISDIFGNQINATSSAQITTTVDDYWGESIVADEFAVIPGYSPSLYSFFTNRVAEVSVQIYKVQPEDFNQYYRFAEAFYKKYEGYLQSHRSIDRGGDKQPPGELVYESRLKIDNPLEFTAHALKLDDAFEGRLGHAMVVLRADKPRKNSNKPGGKVIWIQKTNIGISSINDSSIGRVLTSDLATGEPLNDVQVNVFGQDIVANSDENGIANLTRKKHQDSLALIASKGGDKALLPWNGSGMWSSPQNNSLLWYVVDDRKLYRPGEKIAVKGWLRNYHRKNNGQLSLSGSQNQSIEYIFSDAQGQEIGKGKTDISGLAGFDFEFNLPQDMNLGHCTLKLKLSGKRSEHYHYFRVEEFRRPEFEVLVGSKSGSQNIPHAGAHILGQSIQFNLTAKYFAGGTLANAAVDWNVWSKKGYFTPPNRQDYFFGQQENWWKHFHRHYSHDVFPSGHSIQGKTDSRGEASLSFELTTIQSNSPMLLDVQGSVSDVNRQTFTGASSALIHPASQYVGIKTKSQFYNLGETLKIEAIVADLDGKLLSAQPINIRISANDSYGSSFKPVVCQLQSSEKVQSCETKMDRSGIYNIEATTQDQQGRTHLARQYVWVAGADLPGESVDGQAIKFIGNTENLHEGDELRVMLQSPFAPAQIMLNISREGFIENRIISMETTSELVSINLDERHSPGFELSAHAVGGGDKPSYASGSQVYKVSPDSEIFKLKVSTGNAIVSPGSEVELTIQATHSQGAVKDAEVVVFVVDEAVLATADYRIPDPLEVFHRYSDAGIASDELRAHIKIPPTSEELENLGVEMKEMMASQDMAQRRMKSAKTPAPSAQATKDGVSVRKDFSALALFAPITQTNKDGEAKIKFTLPDSLTRYRITAIAAKDASRFAYSENNITAQLSLMVRPMPPRFINMGDQFELPIVIQNISDKPIETEIALRAQNLHLEKANGYSIEVPANDRVEVRFPVKPNSSGTAEGDVVIHGDEHFDAAHFSFPVWTPLAKESEAIYGEIVDGVHAYPIDFPENAVSDFGGINIKTSATALNTLGDAYVYLRDYPYSCTEQIASRVLSVSALGDLLDNLNVTNKQSKEERLSHLKQDIKILLGRQKHNGSFGLWSQQSSEHSYASIHVIHALFYAKQLNIEVDKNQLQKGIEYLREIEKHINKNYSIEAKQTIRAYALYVASLFDGSQVESESKKLFAEIKSKLETQSLATVAWLLAALPEKNDFDQIRDELIRHIGNHTDQTTSSAHVGSAFTRDGYTHMASTRKNDALVLGALIRQQPQNQLISKFMRGLMDKRIKGRWYNTQENVFVLLSALKYFNQYEKVAPNFVASTWLGKNFAGSSSFKERSTVAKELVIPEKLIESGNQPLTISKQGEGRLYYRVGIDYALNKDKIDARTQGFTVERSFESAEDDLNAVKKSGDSWHIKAGALVRVNITMKVPGQRYYVALVDPLAAGLEALNPSLANSATRPHAGSINGDSLDVFWSRNWFTHQNLRDERAEAFADQLWGGEFKYSYLARATTPGRFIVAPARAEEMYNPETFGRSESDIVIID